MRFGVDEAGKGPVLGSMFAAAVVADQATLPKAIADSKRVAPARREALAADLEADPNVSIGLAEIPVAEIDDPETDMNALTVAAHARALSAVAVDEMMGYVDAGDVDASRFGRRVETQVDAELDLRAEHRADDRYPIVGAASIVAKVARDEHVNRLQAAYDTSIGSGYPGDEQTRAFLRQYVEREGVLPDCARRSWQTSADILAAVTQTNLTEF